MRTIRAILAICATLATPHLVDAATPLHLTQTIQLDGVSGRIDHMAVDIAHHRLFVSALGNDTVEVVDLAHGKRIRSLTGFHEPQGVGYSPSTNRLIVANGGSGDCDILDGTTFERIDKVPLSSDADDVRMDKAGKTAIVGYGDGGLAFLDMATGKERRHVGFRGHPEAFSPTTNSGSIYINVPSEEAIFVIDSRSQKEPTRWPEMKAGANFPIALDETHSRLFVGCREPARLLILNAGTGTVTADVPIDDDADDVYYDGPRTRIYVSCGAGVVDVIDQSTPDHYQSVARVQSQPGARTSLFVQELHRLYVAAPRRGNRPAEILVFDVRP